MAEQLTEGWREALDPATKRILFRYDPARGLIESVCSYWDEQKKKRIRYKVITDLKFIERLPPVPATVEPTDISTPEPVVAEPTV